MWPFRKRRQARVESVVLGEVTTDPADYPVRTVGQSRLLESFEAVGFTPGSSDRFTPAVLTALIDPRMNRVADITVCLDGHVIGYLRPPELDRAVALLDEHKSRTLIVPCRITWSPGGPEVAVGL